MIWEWIAVGLLKCDNSLWMWNASISTDHRSSLLVYAILQSVAYKQFSNLTFHNGRCNFPSKEKQMVDLHLRLELMARCTYLALSWFFRLLIILSAYSESSLKKVTYSADLLIFTAVPLHNNNGWKRPLAPMNDDDDVVFVVWLSRPNDWTVDLRKKKSRKYKAVCWGLFSAGRSQTIMFVVTWDRSQINSLYLHTQFRHSKRKQIAVSPSLAIHRLISKCHPGRPLSWATTVLRFIFWVQQFLCLFTWFSWNMRQQHFLRDTHRRRHLII